jgi:hypothetical protein
MNIKPTAWMKELPTGEGVDRAVRTTTVKEVADDWEQAIPLYTADDLRTAVLAEREQCKEWIATWVEDWCEGWSAKKIAHCIRGDGNDEIKPNKYVTREEPL